MYVLYIVTPNSATSVTIMAKKQVPGERNRTPKKNSNSKTQSKTKTKAKTKSTSAIIDKPENRNRNKVEKTADDDASSEEPEVVVVPSSSTESENDDVVESDGAEENGVENGSSSNEDEEEERETLKSTKKRRRNDGAENKGKKRSKKEDDEDDDESESEEKSENSLYRFPMNRVSRIIRSENPDIKISQEAVFVINRASEKFLQVFCREAYACAFLDNKKHTAYNHLSSVVSRRKRLNFLSDFIPDKVKAEDALKQISEAEK